MNKALNTLGNPYPALPVQFAAWKAAGRKLFETGDTPTLTRVISVLVSGKIDPTRRRAFGWCKAGYRFYIEMSAADEPELKAAWKSWADAHGGDVMNGGPHTFMIDVGGSGPPACGPPNGPPC